MTYSLVLIVAMANGLAQKVTLASGLTQETCEQQLMSAPLPFQVGVYLISYECEVELE